MSFYIVSKGHITDYDFSYVEKDLPVRLEPTQIHGHAKAPRVDTQLRDYYAYELMTKNVITMSPAARIGDAKNLMYEKKFHHLPLVIDHKLTGMISSHDLLNLNIETNLDHVSERMSRLVLCASDSTPLRHVVEVFYRENINALPLVDEEFRLSGIITHRDLLRWLIDHKKLMKFY